MGNIVNNPTSANADKVTRNAMREMLGIDPEDTAPIKFNFTEVDL